MWCSFCIFPFSSFAFVCLFVCLFVFCFFSFSPVKKPFTLWLYARQPGTVLTRLNARQSENSPNFHSKLLSGFLRVLNLSLAMSSDSKNYFGFLVHEMSDRGHTIKWLSRALVLEQFGSNLIPLKDSINELRLKAPFKPFESIWCLFGNINRS